MGSKMLIDAAHPEETRVVSVRGKRLEEFDYESAQSKQLKGNIYLAKVTRVEPSLQAAFVDYGGNRHGFLAFSEIHPDYYQLPIADRQALLEEEEEEVRAANRDLDEDEAGDDAQAQTDSKSENDDDRDDDGDDSSEPGNVDTVGEEDALEEVPQQRRPRRKSYKIQEVIKRRQIILVQVVKEERGNKGAALTTYMSLAGRYCVLMPNTARGGGISRKITDAKDRKRLKEVARDIEVPAGMGLIVRTAGAQRNKSEIRRDFEYLIRLWENVRDLTLKSTAPSLVYEEGNLIKRSIRDLYSKEVDEVLVEGDEAYKQAKAFMKMLMPSHARNVKLYKDNKSLFARFQVEGQLDGLFSPTITLPSGGYLVMNQTEALVSIDINSGKATREHSIEDTAVKTNLEAADEIARQLRLRDLAGLIVIDFIDMEERRNNRAVERRIKDALKTDRARIQVGRISHFGLLEMSRQRLRQSVLEGTTKPCPHCEGTGLIRSIANCALSVLRAIDEQTMDKKSDNLTVKCHPEVAFYILNEKREHILALEENNKISIFILPDHDLGQAETVIERGAVRMISKRAANASAGVSMESAYEDSSDSDEEATSDESKQNQSSEHGDGEEDGNRKRRRRRGRRGGRRSRGRDGRDGTDGDANASDANASETSTGDAVESATDKVSDDAAEKTTATEASEKTTASDAENTVDDGAEKPTKSRRPRRSRKKSITASDETDNSAQDTETGAKKSAESTEDTAAVDSSSSEAADAEADSATEKPKRKPRKRAAKKTTDKTVADAAPDATEASEVEDKPAVKKPAKKALKRAPRKRTKDSMPTVVEIEPPVPVANCSPEPVPAAEPQASTWQPPAQTAPVDTPKKRGWWRRG